MQITLESAPCPRCSQENSLHIDNCHRCGFALPWSGSAATKVLTEPKKKAAKANPNAMLALYIGGGLVCTFGACLWVGNVSGLWPTFPGLGYITILLGGGIIKFGDKILFGE